MESYQAQKSIKIPMRAIEPPDSHHVKAAEGWLELGSPADARHELSRLSDQNLTHPYALAVGWVVVSRLGQWEAAARIGRMLVESAPEHPNNWVNLAYALSKAGRVDEAIKELLQAVDKFPENFEIRYNLACYYGAVGNVPESKAWLKKAEALGDPAALLIKDV
ncbi:MAG: hypothetical protein JWR26_275 [Pedosphaera sp.]|nr:hypothetical protein [Pedosphaera sp.]